MIFAKAPLTESSFAWARSFANAVVGHLTLNYLASRHGRCHKSEDGFIQRFWFVRGTQINHVQRSAGSWWMKAGFLPVKLVETWPVLHNIQVEFTWLALEPKLVFEPLAASNGLTGQAMKDIDFIAQSRKDDKPPDAMSEVRGLWTCEATVKLWCRWINRSGCYICFANLSCCSQGSQCSIVLETFLWTWWCFSCVFWGGPSMDSRWQRFSDLAQPRPSSRNGALQDAIHLEIRSLIILSCFEVFFEPCRVTARPTS